MVGTMLLRVAMHSRLAKQGLAKLMCAHFSNRKSFWASQEASQEAFGFPGDLHIVEPMHACHS